MTKSRSNYLVCEQLQDDYRLRKQGLKQPQQQGLQRRSYFQLYCRLLRKLLYKLRWRLQSPPLRLPQRRSQHPLQ